MKESRQPPPLIITFSIARLLQAGIGISKTALLVTGQVATCDTDRRNLMQLDWRNFLQTIREGLPR
jgi:hypothetical protein